MFVDFRNTYPSSCFSFNDARKYRSLPHLHLQ